MTPSTLWLRIHLETRQDQIQACLVAVEDAHSRKPRHAYFGEQIQIDATPYEWVPNQIWHLHLAIDDATGFPVGAYFDMQETLNGYYHLLYQTLVDYGIPYEIFTDKRSIFNYKRKKSHRLMRIHIRSSDIPVSNWVYSWTTVGSHKQKLA